MRWRGCASFRAGWRDGADAGQPRPLSAGIQVLHVRLADDLVASGLGDDAQLGLRAAASLARLLRGQSRPAGAPALLDPVYDRFSEGFETADLRSAKTLLDALGHAQ
jgi:predicted ATPase